ncbi:MAG: oleate hydratase [Oscillospiraceae bacterium]|nr:oleate hydratase [Oscillospiraceae bacterium]MDY2864965.1 oleate hydratase [Oscillospiraceae bacterium]
MYYSSGNYEAFARPKKPEGVDGKSAYIVGSGLAALTAACYLVRDGQMKGEHVHILEKEQIAGGACDGWKFENVGYVMRGGREMDNHFEVMWDLFRSIPSIETEGVSVLDEYYWLNKADPNYSLCRATVNRGEDAHTDGKFDISDKGAMEIMKLFFTANEDLQNKRITDVFDDEVLNSNFWLYWRTMFAFENWHSALEMKLYIQRFIHHIGGLPDFKALRFTKYNQYESMILPMVKYLESFGVQFHFGVKVVNVEFDCTEKRKQATRIDVIRDGNNESIDLTENDLVFITNGGCVENSSIGSQNTPAPYNYEIKPGGGWDMWRKIAAQDPAFGHPDKFCSDPEQTNWMSATVTTLDQRIIPYIKNICKRDPFSGKVVTGGIVTAKDSSWLLSWTINRQPQFRSQPKDQCLVWVYALFSDKNGDYVKKPMRDCTGKEICMEWLYHIGVPENEIEELAEHSANTVPCMMPYITAFFMPREYGDRPAVVPEGAVNFAFLGQFAETKRDTIFTTEYSMRTGMEAVYTLLDIDRGVPEVWGSVYDVRALLDATVKLRDGKKITDMDVNLIERFALKKLLEKIKGTDIEKLLKEYNVI